MAKVKADEKVWIMKVPKFLAGHLTGKDGRAIGHVQPCESASSAAAGSSSSSVLAPSSSGASYKLTLDDPTLPEGLPREYEMRFSAPPPPTYVVSHAPDASVKGQWDPDFQHEGRAVLKGEIRPARLDGEAYRSLVRERHEMAEAKRSVGIVEDDAMLKKGLSRKDTMDAERLAKEKRSQKRELAASKRARHEKLSKKELRDKVLELFGQQQYWGKPQIQALVGNADILGKCLEELCVKITKRGPHYNDYQLRDEISGMSKA